MADCLGTPLILRVLFQHFSSCDLLQLSLVNKQWDHEARSLIKNRGDITARVNKNNDCQDIRAFASDLRRMKEMKRINPFSGMTIALEGTPWGHTGWCQILRAGELDEVYEEILDQMTWKHLAVCFKRYWDKSDNCPALELVKKIFQNYCGTLEGLSLHLDKTPEFIQTVLPNCRFPRLKTFRYQNRYPPRGSFTLHADETALIKTLISAAPNLQVLYTEDRVDLNANLLEGSSAVHVTDCEYSPFPDEIPEGVVDELKIQRMTLKFFQHLDYDVHRFNSVTSTLLQNSRTTLISMDIEAIYLVHLMRYGICLQSVRELCIRCTGEEIRQPPLWRLLKSFDFNRIFPNLNTVSISRTRYSNLKSMLNAFNEMVEQENAEFMEPNPDRAENIKEISLQWDTVGILDSSTQFLVQMFPDIQKLSIRAFEIPFSRIWESWLDLKELHIVLRRPRSLENFDSVFCGIFPGEVAQLEVQDEEYLRRVNIVPVMPSITCLKGLRTLSMSFQEVRKLRREMDHPEFVLSKVTGLIALQRFPALTVSLTTYDVTIKDALSHLKPYAAIVLRSLADMSLNCRELDE